MTPGQSWPSALRLREVLLRYRETKIFLAPRQEAVQSALQQRKACSEGAPMQKSMAMPGPTKKGIETALGMGTNFL